ncbi:hypothetical protein ABIC83_003075 [Roseateles asaccharophilus]|uniref:hypothetical protein n=1 Tax=Roseateles asaccharophilus TaxID=582607 RepID=UPI0038391C0A
MSDDLKATLAFRCCDLIAEADIAELDRMTGAARDIEFDIFARHVDWKEIADLMGYVTQPGQAGMELAKDRCVSFHSSTWRGERVYYMVHSAIEFVFRKQPLERSIHPSSAWTGVENIDTSPLTGAAAATKRRRPRP